MSFDLPNFYITNDPSKPGTRCGLCDGPTVKHTTSQDYFVGCNFHCQDYKCPQSYNQERIRNFKRIKDLEEEIESLKYEMMGEDL